MSNCKCRISNVSHSWDIVIIHLKWIMKIESDPFLEAEWCQNKRDQKYDRYNMIDIIMSGKQ